MLAYSSTKSGFLQDAPEIGEIVRQSVADRLGINIRRESSEYRSWTNSLGNAMYHVMNASDIPNDAGVAIEYRLHGRQQRVDFMISGSGVDGSSNLVLVELKQWDSVTPSPLDDHVFTYLGGGKREVHHPSYQSWSYSRLLNDFYDVVSTEPIVISPTAYLHNLLTADVVKNARFRDLLRKAPLFIGSERKELCEYISQRISTGDGGRIIERVESSQIHASKQLVDALESMLRGNEEFVLIDDQKTAFERIRFQVRELVANEKAVVLVKGGPGTGKSVIAVNALVDFLGQGLNTRYVTKNAAPRAVYQAKLKGKRMDVATNNLFVSSDSFHTVPPNTYDALVVDEAHRLVAKSGFYRNLGDNQIREVIEAAKVSVFFADESQLVTWRDIGTLENIREAARDLGATVTEMELTAQFRCAGSTDFLEWLDYSLGLGGSAEADLSGSEFEVTLFDNPSELRDFVFAKNQSNNKSRLLAGYCWDWVSKKDSKMYDIVFPGTDFAMKWNLTADGSEWMISPTSINEVGCIHTCQGLEGDYIGVIIGNDLEVVDGRLVGNPKYRSKQDKSLQGFKAAFAENQESALARADLLIRNTYRTLLTRGMIGIGIYCANPEVAAYFRARIGQLAAEQNL
jgi:DUF2075 family protein